MVEYALIIVGVMLIAAGAWRMLGMSMKKNATTSSDELDTRAASGGDHGGGGAGAHDHAGGGGGGGGGGGAGGGGGGGGGGGDKMGASSKVNVGGVGGAEAHGAGGTDDTGGAYATSDDKEATSADITDLKFKRGLGLGFLAAGIIAVGYVFAKARNVKKEVDAQGNTPGDGPPPSV